MNIIEFCITKIYTYIHVFISSFRTRGTIISYVFGWILILGRIHLLVEGTTGSISQAFTKLCKPLKRNTIHSPYSSVNYIGLHLSTCIEAMLELLLGDPRTFELLNFKRVNICTYVFKYLCTYVRMCHVIMQNKIS